MLAGPLDPTFDLVNRTKVFFEPLAVSTREFALQRARVFENCIDHTPVVTATLGTEELIKGERGPGLGPSGRHWRTPRDVGAVEQGMSVLQARDGVFTAQNERGDPRAVTDLPRHDLIEADAGMHLGLGHGCSTEHVARLHAVDHSVVSLFIPKATDEHHFFAPRVKRLEAWAELHCGALAFGPPVFRVEAHAGKCDKRARGCPVFGSVRNGPQRAHAVKQGQGEGGADAAECVAAADEPLVALDVHVWEVGVGSWMAVQSCGDALCEAVFAERCLNVFGCGAGDSQGVLAAVVEPAGRMD